MPNYPLEDITDLKKTQLDIAQDPYVLSVKPEPAKVVTFLVNTKSGGLKAVLRNEFDKIVRGRVTLQQIQEELKVLRAQNVVGKGEPAMGWKLQDPETAKQIECQSKGEFNLEVRRCVLIKKMMKAGQDCKNYLVAIVAKMKTEKQAKQEHKMQEKALKREKNLEMLKPSGELMSSKVALFKEALQLEGDPSEWYSEVLATKLDAGTGRRLCEEAFAAKREEREARSLMISAKESAEILRRFGAGARKSEKKKKGARAFPGNSGESEGAIGREQETKRSHEETQPSLHQEGAEAFGRCSRRSVFQSSAPCEDGVQWFQEKGLHRSLVRLR
eukprot:g62584.t1